MKKKVLTIILCVVMVFGILPVYAFAEDYSDWSYTVNDTVMTATIKGYNGTDTEIVIPERIGDYTVNGIGKDAFRGSKITKIYIPDSVTFIGKQAFYCCSNLLEVRMPKLLNSLGEEAFWNCRKLESIFINLYGNMSESVFEYCDGLKRVEFGDIVTNIGNYAFSHCDELEEVIFNGHKALKIGNNAFSNCFKLKSIEYEVVSGNKYHAVDIGAFAFQSCFDLETVNINRVLNINDYAFEACRSLKSFEAKYFSGILGESAFEKCTALETVEFGEVVTGYNQTIGYWAFQGCSSLKTFVFPRGVTTASACAFCGCTALESIFICENTVAVGESWLNQDLYECPNLTTIYGYTGTYAEEFANNNGYIFIPVSNGDINDDGDVTIADYTMAKAAIDGSNTDFSTYQRNVADYNQDISIDAFDLFEIDKTINA